MKQGEDDNHDDYDHDEDCPLCRGDVSPEFVEMIKAAAEQTGEPMTGDEFRAWLRTL